MDAVFCQVAFLLLTPTYPHTHTQRLLTSSLAEEADAATGRFNANHHSPSSDVEDKLSSSTSNGNGNGNGNSKFGGLFSSPSPAPAPTPVATKQQQHGSQATPAFAAASGAAAASAAAAAAAGAAAEEEELAFGGGGGRASRGMGPSKTALFAQSLREIEELRAEQTR